MKEILKTTYNFIIAIMLDLIIFTSISNNIILGTANIYISIIIAVIIMIIYILQIIAIIKENKKDSE